ncbi:MAG: PaaI family thioesterase, partial [Anaerotignum sp.]|nr:PaaI family thioesterase [Anaerotignum sp.]
MDYNKLIEMRDRENPFSVFLGIKTTKIEKGYAEVELALRPEYMNPTNVVHGGCLYTLGDVASGAAAASFGTKAVTISGEYH